VFLELLRAYKTKGAHKAVPRREAYALLFFARYLYIKKISFSKIKGVSKAVTVVVNGVETETAKSLKKYHDGYEKYIKDKSTDSATKAQRPAMNQTFDRMLRNPQKQGHREPIWTSMEEHFKTASEQ
jgi:hypothetical protein